MSENHRYRDPVTGDPLSRSEYISWKVQGVIRNFWFLGSFTVLTLLVWTLGNHNARDWWNYCASYLAIFIESMVGIAFFGQTRRDALILRHLQKLVEHIQDEVEDDPK